MIKDAIISQPLAQKTIIKRRLANNKKEYLVQKDGVYVWKKQSKSIRDEATKYDQQIKDILPYFPVVFEAPNRKVDIFLENKKIQVSYNGRPVTIDSNLTKKAKVDIQRELNKLFPIQLYEAVYHRAEERKKVFALVNDEDQGQSNLIEEQ